MDVQQLKNFVAVVDAGSMSAAAAKLFVSQPLLSQQVAALESTLSTTLLQRTSRGVAPTPAGTVLYRESLALIRIFDAIPQEVSEGASDIRGTVAIGLPTTLATLLAPELFDYLQERHPGIQLRVFESMSGYIQELLERGRLDLAVTFKDRPGPSEIALYTEDLYLIGDVPDHPLGQTVAVSEMPGLPLVMPAEQSTLRRLVDQLYASVGSTPIVLANVDALPSMLRIAESGRAFTILPRSSLRARLTRDELTARKIDSPILRRTAVLFRLNDRFSPPAAVTAVTEAVKSVIGSHRDSGLWDVVHTRPTESFSPG